MIQSSFSFANLINTEDRKLRKWHPALGFVLYLPICIKFIKSCRTDVKTIYALKQDVRAYVGNLIYGITLQMNVGVDLRAENYKYFCLSDTLISEVIALNVETLCSLGKRPGIKFHWHLETISSRFWLAHILLQKFDTSSEKRYKNDKNTNFIMKNQKIH